MVAKKRLYTDEEKAGTLAVLAGLEGNLAETARRLGIPINTVRNWRDGTGVTEVVVLSAQEKTSALADLFEAMARESLRLADIAKGDATYTQLLSGAALAADKMRALREQAIPTHGGTTQTIIVQYTDINPAAPARIAAPDCG